VKNGKHTKFCVTESIENVQVNIDRVRRWGRKPIHEFRDGVQFH